ncbi:MAG: hypothetical protein ACXACU_15865 [Candidatus Hodarchaeales archaeon]|jgi:hypothetical protein
MKDHDITTDTIDKIQEISELLSYFKEVVLVTPAGSYFIHSMSPARCDERLYIHGVNEDPEDK